MKRSFAFALLALAACTPAPTGPEAAVTAIYKPLVDSKGAEGTRLADIPLSADLKKLIGEAQEAGGSEPEIFDFDLAGNCQDCTGFADLKVAAPASPPPAIPEGHKLVEAKFKLFQGEPHAVQWDMVETPEGWRVDNILADSFNLRTIANEIKESAVAAAALPGPEGDEAVECIAFISLEIDAMEKATPPAKPDLLNAALSAWRTKAEGLFGHDELAQYLASSVAVFDDTPPAELTAKATECATKAPK